MSAIRNLKLIARFSPKPSRRLP